MRDARPTDAIAEIYIAHHGWLQGWLRKKLGCTHHAADLAQDTFTRILASFEKPREASVSLREPRAYLTTIASRILSNHYRRKSLEQAYMDALSLMPEAVAPAPEQRLIVLETLNEIDALLDTMPPKVRAVFLAAQLDGMTYNEISAQLHIPERSVRRYMAQAFERCLFPIL